ncbi:hypothetical protein [Pedobacter paludis]|uniref:Uncharacterized protein n=1 Tax=Pedobacter paludis TaxID=2203212 RepID=A0A317EZ63_9SPHI|nr:hypothetical protein [Pedobacter paludis]PWS32181.1 hypothetical protein DF947_10450 [Pedobacter paludis]
MDENNLKYLSNKLFGIGMDDDLEGQLKVGVQAGHKEFFVSKEFNNEGDKQKVNVKLERKENLGHEFYSIKNIHHRFENQGQAVLEYTFPYIPQMDFKNGEKPSKSRTVTVKEAYNLSKERSVLKQDDFGNPKWMVGSIYQKENVPALGIQSYTGYNHREVLKNFPLDVFQNKEREERFFNSIERGNQQSVSFMVGNEKIPVYVEIAATYKSQNFFDEGKNRLYKEDLEKILGTAIPLGPQNLRENKENNVSKNISADGQSVVNEKKNSQVNPVDAIPQTKENSAAQTEKTTRIPIKRNKNNRGM